MGGATAAALAVIVGATLPLWSHPEAVSAQVILDRAQATANNASLTVTSYHLEMTRQIPAKENATITTELWYGGKDRQRSDQRTVDAQGKVISTEDVISHGNQTWIALSQDGQVRAVHTTGTDLTASVQSPSEQASLADVLTSYSAGKNCMTATQQGEATVAKRPTYVIVLHPRPGGCTPPGGTGDNARGIKGGSSSRAGVAPQNDTAVAEIVVWVDQQSFLPLKTEVRNAVGVVLDRSEVTSVAYNVAIPDSVFSYSPPAGATISNINGGDGADLKRALVGNPSGKNPPESKP
ncbi:MAG: LolA family protein [Chloroflexota bacterium]